MLADNVHPERKIRRTQHRPPGEPFAAPAGMNPNEVCVEGIVKSQIEKILPLLLSAQAAGDFKQDIRIGTACSGTDPPVLGTILDMEVLGKSDVMF